MNCQDIARILDDQDIAGLSAADQQSVKLHLASCHECTSEWQLHAQLAATAMPALPQELRASCRTLVIAGSGVDTRARKRSRLIVASTLLVVAAAAMLLGLQLSGPTQLPPVAAAPASDFSLTTPKPAEVVTEVVAPAAEPAAAPGPVSWTPRSFTVSVMPVNHDAALPASRVAIDAFHASLLEELRKVPNLVLVESQAEYRIALRGLAPDAPRDPMAPPAREGVSPGRTNVPQIDSVRTATIAAPGASATNATTGAGQWRVEVVVDVVVDAAGQKLTDNNSYFASETLDGYLTANISGSAAGGRYSGQVAGVLAENCPAPAAQSASRPYCSDPGVMAASQVVALREHVFPSDPSMQQQLLAKLRDPESSVVARTRTSVEFQSLLRQRRIIWDGATIRAVLDLAIASPDTGISWWGALRGVRSPGLVQPLLAAMRNGAEEKVRLGAMSVLQSDYASEPQVRAAFETVAREDPQELVRQSAQRILYGDAGWRSYVVANLANISLTDDARLAPLAQTSRSSDLTTQLPAIMDDQATAALAEMLPRLWSNRQQTQTVFQVLGVLGRTGHAGAVGLVTEALRNAPENQLMSLVVNLSSSRYLDDPRVQKALDDAGARSPQLQKTIESMRAVQQKPSSQPLP